MSATNPHTRRRKPKLSKTRVSPPMLTEEAIAKLAEIGEMIGSSIPGLLAQVGEAAKKGKAENWHRALAAFQDSIEK